MPPDYSLIRSQEQSGKSVGLEATSANQPKRIAIGSRHVSFDDIVGEDQDGQRIVKPSAPVARKLITSSNLVGCSIGSSAGLAPFISLSAYVVARRQIFSRRWVGD
jgi:hypothetical protein